MDINKIMDEMTLDEKAGLCSGGDFWHTKSVERLGIPQMMLSDGPHGLRKQDVEGDHLGINDSIEAVCFPTGCTIASSFDRDLIYEVGEALGESCQAEGVGVILGPAMNIKRSPLCGRNFEYLSEDPYLSGAMAASQVKGIHSKNIGTSIKHFLANNQEHRRMSSSSEVDERTLREIYMSGFEKAVKEAQPWTVMCSYNRINGEYASESHRFLTEVLRHEWGFEGFVVSDWGAVNDRVLGLKAGMDLEMPSSHGLNDKKIVDAVKNGRLDETVLDLTVERILTMVDRFEHSREKDTVFDRDAQHELARKAATESMVLLKNEGILPLSKNKRIAFIGEFADQPRFQGGGSSHINAFKFSSALESAPCKITYAKGYNTGEQRLNQGLIDEAVAIAAEAEVAVIFAGLPDAYECEGYDRSHMALPPSQDDLIREVVKVQSNVVVVLHNGSPVEMPWADEVKGILEAYLSGQAVGEATNDILFGDVNPSGKLAETFPVKLEDNPSYLTFPGEGDTAVYNEGIFVGYRYYDKKAMDVLFPFGHGLSYTDFAYSNMTLSSDDINEKDVLTVTVDVTNTGDRFGKEVVQLYVTDLESHVIRPLKELKGFEKIPLGPGETGTVTFKLDRRAFAYFNTELNDWYVETGDFIISVGGSSRNIRLKKKLHVVSETVLKQTYTMNSLFGDIMADAAAKAIVEPLLKGMEEVFEGDEEAKEGPSEAANEAITDEMKEAMYRYMPLRNFVTFGNGSVTFEMIEGLIKQLNSL